MVTDGRCYTQMDYKVDRINRCATSGKHSTITNIYL